MYLDKSRPCHLLSFVFVRRKLKNHHDHKVEKPFVEHMLHMDVNPISYDRMVPATKSCIPKTA